MNTVKTVEKQQIVYGIITEPNNFPLNNDKPPTVNYNVHPITSPASFKCKSSITGKTLDNDDENDNRGKNKEVKIVAPLKHLGNFSRTLDVN